MRKNVVQNRCRKGCVLGGAWGCFFGGVFGGVFFYKKKIREANEVFAVDKNISFLRVDFGQGSALNQETAPVNLVPKNKKYLFNLYQIKMFKTCKLGHGGMRIYQKKAHTVD